MDLSVKELGLQTVVKAFCQLSPLLPMKSLCRAISPGKERGCGLSAASLLGCATVLCVPPLHPLCTLFWWKANLNFLLDLANLKGHQRFNFPTVSSGPSPAWFILFIYSLYISISAPHLLIIPPTALPSKVL